MLYITVSMFIENSILLICKAEAPIFKIFVIFYYFLEQFVSVLHLAHSMSYIFSAIKISKIIQLSIFLKVFYLKLR